MTQPTTPTNRVIRTGRLRWIPIADMRVSPLAQRELRPAFVDSLAVEFDPEQIGTPIVNLREGHWYIIDGHHRIEAMRKMGWGDQEVFCEIYEGLTEQQEAEMFLRRNRRLNVRGFDEFKVGVTAGRAEPTEIDRMVRTQGLVISTDKIPGAIGAVGTLVRVYRRTDSVTLGRTLRLIRDAYGDAGLEAPVIDGIGYLCGRYNGELNDADAVKKLGDVHGGVNGLLNKAANIRRETGNAKAQCIAAAAVEILNRGRGGKKLPDWFKKP